MAGVITFILRSVACPATDVKVQTLAYGRKAHFGGAFSTYRDSACLEAAVGIVGVVEVLNFIFKTS